MLNKNRKREKLIAVLGSADHPIVLDNDEAFNKEAVIAQGFKATIMKSSQYQNMMNEMMEQIPEYYAEHISNFLLENANDAVFDHTLEISMRVLAESAGLMEKKEFDESLIGHYSKLLFGLIEDRHPGMRSYPEHQFISIEQMYRINRGEERPPNTSTNVFYFILTGGENGWYLVTAHKAENQVFILNPNYRGTDPKEQYRKETAAILSWCAHPLVRSQWNLRYELIHRQRCASDATSTTLLLLKRQLYGLPLQTKIPSNRMTRLTQVYELLSGTLLPYFPYNFGHQSVELNAEGRLINRMESALQNTDPFYLIQRRKPKPLFTTHFSSHSTDLG
jgi:hypothetical protein